MDRLADILSRAFLSMILKKLAYKFFSLMISIPSFSAVLLYPPVSIIKAASGQPSCFIVSPSSKHGLGSAGWFCCSFCPECLVRLHSNGGWG